MGVWAAQHRRVQHVRQVDVVDEQPATGQKSLVLVPPYR
jgi:hypothetical protein